MEFAVSKLTANLLYQLMQNLINYIYSGQVLICQALASLSFYSQRKITKADKHFVIID